LSWRFRKKRKIDATHRLPCKNKITINVLIGRKRGRSKNEGFGGICSSDMLQAEMKEEKASEIGEYDECALQVPHAPQLRQGCEGGRSRKNNNGGREGRIHALKHERKNRGEGGLGANCGKNQRAFNLKGREAGWEGKVDRT